MHLQESFQINNMITFTLFITLFFLVLYYKMTTKPQLKSISLPLKVRLQITTLNIVSDIACRTKDTVNRRLMRFIVPNVPPLNNPGIDDNNNNNSVTSHDVIFDAAKNLWFRLFVPHLRINNKSSFNTSRLPVLVFFHGGGFVFFRASSFCYDEFCRRLTSKLNVVVCSIDYRLAPEHKYPCQYDDGFTALKFLDNPDNISNISHWPENADVSTVFLTGDSAGGNLAHHLAVNYSKASSSFSLINVVGLINIQPFFGGKERVNSESELETTPTLSMKKINWAWKAFLPNGQESDHWAINVSGPNAVDIHGLNYPPTLMFVGGFDMLKDWQMRYYQWLRNNGKDVKLVEYSTAIHGFYVFPQLSENDLLFVDIKEFIDKQVSLG